MSLKPKEDELNWVIWISIVLNFRLTSSEFVIGKRFAVMRIGKCLFVVDFTNYFIDERLIIYLS